MKENELTIIIGAGGGIGSCISRHIVSQSKPILLIDNDKLLLENIVNELKNSNNNVMFEKVDITNAGELEPAIKKYERQYNFTNIINCAGISFDGTSKIEYQSFRKMMEVNFWGFVNVINAVLPFMEKRKKGHIIVLVSQSGKRARAKTGAYAATKFALMGYIEGLQKELLSSNIKISALCPGMVNTRQTDDEPDYDKSKMIQPDELLCVIDFLLNIPYNASVKEVVFECVQQLERQG